jgi:hypothetical protein
VKAQGILPYAYLKHSFCANIPSLTTNHWYLYKFYDCPFKSCDEYILRLLKSTSRGPLCLDRRKIGAAAGHGNRKTASTGGKLGLWHAMGTERRPRPEENWACGMLWGQTVRQLFASAFPLQQTRDFCVLLPYRRIKVKTQKPVISFGLRTAPMENSEGQRMKFLFRIWSWICLKP